MSQIKNTSYKQHTICLLIGNLKGWGTCRVCVTMANGLAERGWNVTLLVLNLRESVLDSELDPRIRLIDLKVSIARHSIFKLAKFISSKAFERILVFNHQLAIILIFLRKILRKNYKIISRNISTLSKLPSHYGSVWYTTVVDLSLKVFYRFSDVIIAQSENMAVDLIKNYGIKPDKLRVIYNPVCPSFENMRVYEKRNGSPDYFLCVGRLTSEKGFHFAIKAFSEISGLFPKLRLKFLGDGPDKTILSKLAQSLGISEKIDFEGFQTDTIPYYLNAKALILTSLFEGFPNVLVESISLGTPIIAFDCESGPKEIVIDGVNGFLVPYKDAGVLAEKMRLCLVSPFNREEVILSADRYSSKKIISQLEDLILSVSPA